MKPRIEKKLSKKLAAILGSLQGFKGIWVDDSFNFNKHLPHQKWMNPNGLTGKQKRENWQVMGVSVNHMPSIGGNVDYFSGEYSEVYSVYCAAKWLMEWDIDPEDSDRQSAKGSLTGARVIRLAQKYIAGRTE